jgi:hypothetical protein
LEGLLAVMVGLVGEVGLYWLDVRVADCEGAVAGLPFEIVDADLVVDPARGVRLDDADSVGNRKGARQRHEQVNVIRNAAGGDQGAVVIAGDAADVFEEAGLEFGVDVGVAMFGAEDEVAVEGGEGLGHGRSPTKK